MFNMFEGLDSQVRTFVALASAKGQTARENRANSASFKLICVILSAMLFQKFGEQKAILKAARRDLLDKIPDKVNQKSASAAFSRTGRVILWAAQNGYSEAVADWANENVDEELYKGIEKEATAKAADFEKILKALEEKHGEGFVNFCRERYATEMAEM